MEEFQTFQTEQNMDHLSQIIAKNKDQLNSKLHSYFNERRQFAPSSEYLFAMNRNCKRNFDYTR